MTYFTQLVKHLHQSILPNDNMEQIKNTTLKLILTETNDYQFGQLTFDKIQRNACIIV